MQNTTSPKDYYGYAAFEKTKTVLVVFDKILRSGDCTDAAQECELQTHGVFS